jgi:single-strand DNA-binding protein
MINKVILLGNLSSDVELKHSQSGTAYAKFSLATNKPGKDGKSIAQFHRITCFNKLAENVAKYLSKGRQAYLEGEINYTSSEGKDGTKKYFTDIIAFEVKFIGGKKEDSQEELAGNNSILPASPPVYTEADIPF